MKFTWVLNILFFHVVAAAATFQGTVVDSQSGEALPGVAVSLNTGESTLSDLNGDFIFKNLSPLRRVATLRLPSYEPTVFMFTISSSGATIRRTFELKKAQHVLNELKVTGALDKNSQQYAFSKELKSANLTNVTSGKQLALSPDVTVGQAMQRLPGVSLERSSQGESRFPIIRGMEKRYLYTSINGVKIPSPDNKNRYVPLDIFPAELLQRLEVNKTLLPSMEGDAIGGSINLVTKSAPDAPLFDAYVNTGYSGYQFHHPFEYVSRSTVVAKSPGELRGNAYSAKASDFSTDNLNFKRQAAMPYAFAGLSAGRRFFRQRLGLLFSTNAQQSSRGSEQLFFSTTINKNNAPEFVDLYARRLSLSTKRVSFLMDADWRLTQNSQLKLSTLNFSQNSFESRLSSDTSFGPTRVGAGTGKVTTYYRSRLVKQMISNLTLQGKHQLLPIFSLNWSGVYSLAKANQPDWSELSTFSPVSSKAGVVSVDSATFQGINTYWQHNTDRDLSFYLSLRLAPFKRLPATITAGELIRNKVRDNYFNAYKLDALKVQDQSGLTTFPTFKSVSEVSFTVANPFGTTSDARNYRSKETISAYYLQIDLTIKRFDIALGARTEATNQSFNTLQDAATAGSSGRLTYRDFLPSINAKYNLSKSENLLFAYYKALARPNYFELIPYSNPAEENFGEAGNPLLKHTTAQNYDLRWQQKSKQFNEVSVGVFVKRITNPIEYLVKKDVIVPSNALYATNKGFELTGSKFFRHIGLSGNYTFTLSQTTVDLIRNQENLSLGQALVESKRPLQGQSRHLGNLSLLLIKENFHGQLSLVYTGSRIVQTSQFQGLDYYQRGITTLDASFEKKWGRVALFAKGQNLLNTPAVVEIHAPYPRDVSGIPLQKKGSSTITQRELVGSVYLIGVKYKLFN